MCAIVFLVFTFCYIYFYQAESLAYLQHTLSQGKTHYERTIGAFIITTLAVLLQYAVFRITGLRKRGHIGAHGKNAIGAALPRLTERIVVMLVEALWLCLTFLDLAGTAASCCVGCIGVGLQTV